ncbi:MAG: Na+/H+ antiporter NhaC family protein [Gammaproteobacteria bacterium]|jgi:Na+/H+ antiporter NhaC
MENITFIGSAWSLLPPFVAIVMAVITHRVLISLGAGILVGAALINQFDIQATLSYLGSIVVLLVWEDGKLNAWNILIILFLCLLGIIACLITISGGKRAFTEWALLHVKSKRGARLFTVFLGMFLFIDDYFNTLTVGNIARPLTDAQHVPRAKLAYLVDSVAASICMLCPFSSWGAYIMGIMSTLLVAHHVLDYSALTAFITIIPMNLYPIFALLMALSMAYLGWDIFAMKKHYHRAKEGELYDKSKGAILGAIEGLHEYDNGFVYDLIIPIVTLIIATVFSLLFYGYVNIGDNPISFFTLLENTDVALALVTGASTGLLVTLILYCRKQLHLGDYGSAIKNGVKAMSPAIYILLFAWTIIQVINELNTGLYLAHLIDDINLSLAYLPLLLFLVAGITAFSTGTSWGTFGIMLPLAADIVMVGDPNLLMPAFAAVLAGSVFGDHCSPISDTTILSATGAGANHIDHVVTQLPYALLIALISGLGFLVLGFTGSALLAFASSSAAFLVCLFIMKFLSR